jgi:hypothetical protein
MTKQATIPIIAFALMRCLAPNLAHANDCETTAATIAKGAGLEANKRTPADFVPLSAVDGEYGAFLNCSGTYGMNLRFLSQPNPAADWFQFVGLASSIFVKVSASAIRKGVQACLDSIKHSGNNFANLERESVRFICDVGENDGRIELTIAK